MKATGIVRRIDDLGRVVIPKEIRRTLRIREGDPLEIFTGKDGEVVFKKYSPFSELTAFAAEYAAALQAVSGFGCAIADRDNVIAYAGSGKREILDRPLSEQAEELIASRRAFITGSDTASVPLLRENDKHRIAAARPILASGDILGMVCFLMTDGAAISATEEKLLQTAALFLGKQMES